jgi:hypothetical protein
MGKSAAEFPQIIRRMEIFSITHCAAPTRANARASRASRACRACRASIQHAQYTLRVAAETISRNSLKL